MHSRKQRILALLLTAALLVPVVLVPVCAASGCGFSSCSCSSCSKVVQSYVSVGAEGHYIVYKCSGGCGAYGGSSLDGVYGHSWSNGRCSLCGYSCSHSDWSNYTNGCVSGWYCNICGYTSYSGSHSYLYGDYTYYSATQHRRYYYCRNCTASGTTGYQYGNHSWQYSGDWEYDGSQHFRYGTCSICGYSGPVYSDHTLRYSGGWTYDDTNHYRTASCSTCGWSGTYSAPHDFESSGGGGRPRPGEGYTAVDSEQHKRSVRCATCGYNGTQYSDHNFKYRTYGATGSYYEESSTRWKWTYNETEHYRDRRCDDCGYSDTEYQAHDWVCSDFESISDIEHSFTMTCSVCGYSVTQTAEHGDEDSDGFCDDCGHETARFSVTVPALLPLVMAEDGTVFTARDAVIENLSTGEVVVTAVTVQARNGWTLVPYATSMAEQYVDSRLIGVCINGACTESPGDSEALEINYGNWKISSGEALPLEYDAVISAVSQPVTGETVLELVFVVDWA